MDKFLPETTFAILAGGKSSRFGSNKVFYDLNGKPMLSYIVDLARQLCSEVLIIGDYNYKISDPVIKCVKDEFKEIGPIGGIFTALNNSSNPNVIISPVDMPFLTKDIFITLHEKLNSFNGSVISLNNKLEPLLSIWKKNQSEYIKNNIQNEKYAIRKLIDELHFTKVNINTESDNLTSDHFKNVNYKSDLE